MGAPQDRQKVADPTKSSIRQVLEARTEQVELAALAQKKRFGRVVTWKLLEGVLAEAVENLLLAGAADPLLEPERLQQQASAEFQRLLAARQQVEGDDELGRADHERLQRQQQALKDELDRQVDRLESEERLRAARLRLSGTSLDEIERRTRRALNNAVEEALAGGGDAGALASLRRSLPAVIDEVVATQRAAAAAELQRGQDDEMDRLRRRIEKLTEALERTEATLAEVIAAKELDPGIASIYRSPEGLLNGARNYTAKKEFLQVVFVNNLLLRGLDVLPEDLKGVREEFLLDTAALRNGVGAAASAAVSAAEPQDPLTDETAF